jgi:iron(III) transport system substrate-binding protein
MTDYIVKEFRQRTNIPVRVVSAGTGELIAKVKELKGKQEADVFWGGGIESLETIVDEFAEYRGPEDGAIVDAYKSAHGLWSPFSVLPVVIIYNVKLVPKDRIPDSWARLLDPYFSNRIIMADPSLSGSSYTTLVTILRVMSKVGADDSAGWDYIDKLIVQLGSEGLALTSKIVCGEVALGDFFAGITLENSALSIQKSGSDVGFCYPKEGTSAVPDGIALFKGTRKPAQAKKFIDFVLGYDVQSILMARWSRRSVRKDIPEYDPEMAKMRFISYPIEESVSRREAILSRWAAARARENRP